MKKMISVLLSFVLLFGCFASVSADTAEYIAVHTEEELNALFERVSSYMQENEDTIETQLGETESMIVASAYLRAWGITQYDDATPEQMDEAYDALYNSFLFMGLVMEVRDNLYTDPEMDSKLYQLSAQLLDQEYYDLMQTHGESEETIANAEYLRDQADVLIDNPESFTDGDREQLYADLYTELYLASGMKALDHTEMLPTPSEIFEEDPDSAAAMIPNPVETSEDSADVDALLGFAFPDLTDRFALTLEYYGVIADVVAEAEYTLDESGIILFRLSPETSADISGVYGAEWVADWTFYGTETEIDKYQTMYIAKGVVELYSGEHYAFAVDAEGVDLNTFEPMVKAFIEDCRNAKKEN